MLVTLTGSMTSIGHSPPAQASSTLLNCSSYLAEGMVRWAKLAKTPNSNNGLQALARMGASVTGIEPQQDNLKAAVAHARGDVVVAARTRYLACTAEELAGAGMVSTQFSSCIRY